MIFSMPLLSTALVYAFMPTPSEGSSEERLLLFENGISELYCEMDLAEAGLGLEAFRHAMIGYYILRAGGNLGDQPYLTIIDFTQSCNAKRFYTLNLKERTIEFQELVAHGENTGREFAKHFSNRNQSHQSSLGFFVTGETYNGRRGFSLKLDGQESGFNSNVRDRGVVVHGAEYVDEKYIADSGTIGRSWGCPALDFDVCEEVIETIKDKTCVFAWYPDNNYLKYSRLLNAGKAAEEFAKGQLAAAN
jgi:hypothetical protein